MVRSVEVQFLQHGIKREMVKAVVRELAEINFQPDDRNRAVDIFQVRAVEGHADGKLLQAIEPPQP